MDMNEKVIANSPECGSIHELVTQLKQSAYAIDYMAEKIAKNGWERSSVKAILMNLKNIEKSLVEYGTNMVPEDQMKFDF